MRKEGYFTKIREGKKDYLLLAKKKEDKTPWGKIAPRIEPANLPLFEVGRLTKETIVKIREEEAIRRKEQIERMERMKADQEEEEEKEINREMEDQKKMIDEERKVNNCL